MIIIIGAKSNDENFSMIAKLIVTVHSVGCLVDAWTSIVRLHVGSRLVATASEGP